MAGTVHLNRYHGTTMAWRVEKNKESGFIEIDYTDVVTNRDIQESTMQALSLATPEGPNLFLADLSGSQANLSPLDIYAIPEQWENAQARRSDLLAVVVTETTLPPGDARLVEDVTVNRGWRVRMFLDRRAAIAWLRAG
jgi:hypothetical protein